MSRPRPRTSVTCGRPVIASRSWMPRAAAFSTSPARSISPSTALAVAVASGLPPNVLPWLPATSRSDAAPNVMSAPIGNPPPMPFATAIASGMMPKCWNANQSPVRPAPVWISSRMSSAPCASRELAGGLEVTLGKLDDARLALDRLDDEGCDILADARLRARRSSRGGAGRRAAAAGTPHAARACR